jgi:tetratricopeptide (TPR) repeat protein
MTHVLSESRDLQTGDRRLGKYRIVRTVAHGGTCDVLEAIDPDLGRRVAIKVLRDGTIDRLRAEATAAARLHHPNIVAVHEVGPTYIVMDFIAGRTLAEVRPSLPLVERVRIIETVARAVEHAHGKGVVHRDLKPANILLETGGRVVLTDFGIAKLLDGEDLTVTGSVMGTPHYMAPEQVQGRGFGPSVDVWALGVLLYEAVKGQRPFEATSALDIYDQIVRRDPARLSGALGAITGRALEKDPRRRYPSAEALAEDLACYLRGDSISVPVLWPRVRRLLPRLGIAAAAVALAGGLYFEHRQALKDARLANRPVEAAELDKFAALEERANAALERNPRDTVQLLKRSQARQRRGDLARDHGRSPLAFYAAALADMDRALEIDPQGMDLYLQRSRVYTQRAVYKARYGIDPLADLDAAEKALEAALSDTELRPLRGNLRYHRGMWLNRTGQDGRPFLVAAEADLTPAADTEAYMRRGRVRAALGKLDAADNDYAIALDKRPRDGWGWVRRGEARLAGGDLGGAERYLDEAVRVDPQRADAYEIRGHVRFARGEFGRALSDYEDAIARNPALVPMLAERMNQARSALKGK